MARYFARHITDQTYAERRACALRLSIWGGIWLVAALLILLVVHQITGTWSAHGPWLVGWIVVICAAVRVVGGMLLLPHRKDMSSITLTDGSIDAHPTGLAPLATTGSILDFQLLGLRPDSSPDDVRRAHRELAQIWHPDRFADSADLRVRAEQRMKQINAAYARLSVKVPAHAIEVGAGAD